MVSCTVDINTRNGGAMVKHSAEVISLRDRVCIKLGADTVALSHENVRLRALADELYSEVLQLRSTLGPLPLRPVGLSRGINQRCAKVARTAIVSVRSESRDCWSKANDAG